jgi:hypothetical protein
MKSEREREREGRNSKRKNKKREDEKSRPGLAGRLAGCCSYMYYKHGGKKASARIL